MSTENRVLLAQIIGLVAIVLARFGIDLDAQAQADILAGLSAFGLLLTAVLAKAKGASSPTDKQSGRAALPALLLALGLASLLLVALPGCGALPETPRQAIAASYVTIESLAETAEIAHRDGHIDDQQRAVIRANLQTAMNALREARQIEAAGGDAEGRLQYVRSILIAVQSLLPEVPAHE